MGFLFVGALVCVVAVVIYHVWGSQDTTATAPAQPNAATPAVAPAQAQAQPSRWQKVKQYWQPVLGTVVAILLLIVVIRYISGDMQMSRDRKAAEDAKVAAAMAECYAKELASSIEYTKVVRADSPAIETIPFGWSLQSTTEEDKVVRTLSRSGSDLIEKTVPAAGVESIEIGFRLYRKYCALPSVPGDSYKAPPRKSPEAAPVTKPPKQFASGVFLSIFLSCGAAV